MRIQNKKHGIYRVNGGKEYKASRLGGLERVRGGEKVINRMRESKEGKPICSSRLSRPCFTLHELMSRVWPVRRSSQTESIVVSVSIHQINSVHSLSRDNPRIPTNPLSGSQQPPLL